MTSAATSDPELANDRRAIRIWMQASIVAVFAAVIVGGITRLTDSGLSITEWKPIAGVVPPMTEAGWQAAFESYLRIPQAQTTHIGIDLARFRVIYWWEWLHRLVARGVGLIFALPYLWFLLRGRIPRGLHLRLAALPLLTLAQGVLGWYMVKSGLAERPSVSAYRLAAHLTLALAILVAAVWTRQELLQAKNGDRQTGGSRRWRRMMSALFAMICLTIVSGAFVAGLDAGRIYNTFPLMQGALIPTGYAGDLPWWRNAFENPVAAQLHHRVLALATAAFAIFLAIRARRSRLPTAASKAVQDVGRAAGLQVVIGVTTLLLSVPVWAGVLHQFVGVMVLGAASVALHAVLRPATVPSSG